MDDEISSKVELHISARNLPKMDYFSKSDPVVFVEVRDGRSDHPHALGNTEVLQNTHDPDFQKAFMIDYFFEENQIITFHVYDSDGGPAHIAPPESNKIGFGRTHLADLVSAKGATVDVPCMNEKGTHVTNGKGQQTTIVTRCEEVSGLNEHVKMRLSLRDLRGGFCISPCPRLEFFRMSEDQSWQKVYTTPPPTKVRTRHPIWAELTIRLQTLCCNDEYRPILIKAMNYKNPDIPVFLGQCETTLKALMDNALDVDVLETVTESRDENETSSDKFIYLSGARQGSAGPSKYRNAGILIVDSCKKFEIPMFIDYIMGGMELQLMIAIDFTASNGDPAFPDSLHYLDRFGERRNIYEKAIISIGKILTPYDSDQQIPVWGFGARLRRTGNVSHLFPLTFNPNNDSVSGIDGILSAYHKAFEKVQLSGPTYFTEVIRRAREISSMSEAKGEFSYSILLIITDGVVNDRKQTIAEVVEASNYPLSLIVVGVGDADFSDMEILDADNNALESNGTKAKRDIVQFVPMNQFRASETSRLAAEVLAEVPEQVVEYMMSKNIKPPTSSSKKRRKNAKKKLPGTPSSRTSRSNSMPRAMSEGLHRSKRSGSITALGVQRKNSVDRQGSSAVSAASKWKQASTKILTSPNGARKVPLTPHFSAPSSAAARWKKASKTVIKSPVGQAQRSARNAAINRWKDASSTLLSSKNKVAPLKNQDSFRRLYRKSSTGDINRKLDTLQRMQSSSELHRKADTLQRMQSLNRINN